MPSSGRNNAMKKATIRVALVAVILSVSGCAIIDRAFIKFTEDQHPEWIENNDNASSE